MGMLGRFSVLVAALCVALGAAAQSGPQVTEAKLKELEEKKLAARAVYKMLKALSDRHAKTSKNFWN